MASATQRIILSSGWQKIAEAKGREAMALIDAYGAVQLAIADGEPPRGDVANGHALNGSMMWPVRGAEIVWARGSGVAVSVTLLKVVPEFAPLDSAAVKSAAASAMMAATAADGKAVAADAKATQAQRAAGRHPMDFGAVLDGAVDDTEAIRDLHAWCNANNVPPSYKGVQSFAVQADAQIIINTSVDFCGAEIRLLNGIVETPGFDAMSKTFVISDASTPVVTGTVAVTDGNLAKGSRTPTADFWTQPGYVYMQGADPLTSPLIVDRTGANALTYRQMFKVVKNGRVVHPLARAMTGAGTVYYRARANSSRGWVTVQNFTVNASTFNNAVLFEARRNQVAFGDVSVIHPDGLPPSINAIIKYLDCCDGVVRNITSPAMTSFGGSNGTYLVQTDYAAEIKFDNLQADNGWGAIGTNLTSGLYFTNCRLNRIDIHFMGFNLFVDGCVISDNGVVFGCGGGALVIRGSTFIECPVLSSRPDYGGYWFGYCDVSDVTLERNLSAFATVLDMTTNPVGFSAAGVATLPLFESIRISGAHRAGYVGTCYFAPVRIKVRSGAEGKITAPLSVVVQEVTGAASSGWTLYNELDILNMVQATRVEVVIADINPSRQPTTGQFDTGYQLLRMWAKVGSHTVPPLGVSVADVANVAVDLSLHTTAPRLELHGCKSIRRAVGGQGGRTIITGGTLDGPVLSGAETAGKLGNAGTSGAYNIVALLGVEVSGSWDLSQCSHMAANIWSSSQDAGITLPGGVTWAIQAAGWRA